jgi:hypothetical protein
MDSQIAKADYYFDDADRNGLALSGEHLLVSKGGIVFEPLLTIYGFVDGVPAGVTLPEPEGPKVERRPLFPEFASHDG